MNLGPCPDDEGDGVEPQPEHEDHDDHVLDGDLGQLGLSPRSGAHVRTAIWKVNKKTIRITRGSLSSTGPSQFQNLKIRRSVNFMQFVEDKQWIILNLQKCEKVSRILFIRGLSQDGIISYCGMSEVKRFELY